MTQRKPPGVSYRSWVERQIRTAEAKGAFENLPLHGKPIPGIDRPQQENAWIASYLRRENTDVSAVLPPALAIAKEVEVLPERLARERSEAAVRTIVDDLNLRIVRQHARPQDGPVFRVRRVNVEDAVEQWRAGRPLPPAPVRQPVADEVPALRRRGLRRRRCR